MPILKRYLPAFFFYSMGVQTIMLVAASFGAKELKMETSSQLITDHPDHPVSGYRRGRADVEDCLISSATYRCWLGW